MLELIKLDSFTFGVNGDALEFTLDTECISPSDITKVIIESNTGESVELTIPSDSNLDVNRVQIPDFTISGTKLTLKTTTTKYLTSIYQKFKESDLVVITVKIDEGAVQECLIENGSTECTKPYASIPIPIYDLYFLRKQALDYLPELHCCECDIPKEFIDKLLQINAIEYALKCGEVKLAKKLWNKFINAKAPKQKGCGCNGRN